MSGIEDRIAGSLLGLACGDCVGAAVEFKAPGSFKPLTDMVASPVWRNPAGFYTDDTSLALCVAQSLVERRAYDPTDQMRRACNWYNNGYLSPTGHCFDIGNATRAALNSFEASKSRKPYSGSTAARSAGNGSLMRLCPVPLLLHQHPSLAIQLAGDCSRTTHGAETCIDACHYFGALLVGALQGATKEQLLTPGFVPNGVRADIWTSPPLHHAVADVVLRGSYVTKEPPDIKNDGYVVPTLEAALWAFRRSSSFEEGCLLVANLGIDSDTVAAIYGQLAGAFYGLQAIPTRWVSLVMFRDLMLAQAKEIASMASLIVPNPQAAASNSSGGDDGDLTERFYQVAPQYEHSDVFVAVSDLYSRLYSGFRELKQRQGATSADYDNVLEAEEMAATRRGTAAGEGVLEACQGIIGDFERQRDHVLRFDRKR